MTAGRKRVASLLAVALALSACQTLPANPVTAASQAIDIAIGHCTIDPGDSEEKNAANWTATRVGDAWNVTYLAPPALSAGNVAIGSITTNVSARDGRASDCLARMVVSAH